MNSLLELYQNLPEHINPIVFSTGSFSLRWYSLMYLVAFFLIVSILKRDYLKSRNADGFLWDDVFDFLCYCFLGIMIGARIGFALIYNFQYFVNNPAEIFLPISNGEFVGLYGMSFYGGVLGFVSTAFVFSKIKKIDLLLMTDFVVSAIPAGYFFGRLGNFLNGELYGRVTDSVWGMNFGDGFLRHPSQLYEAFFEGLILFLILRSLKGSDYIKKGMLSFVYLAGYSFFRFFVEFFREPDTYAEIFFGFLTTGQMLSIIVFLVALFYISLACHSGRHIFQNEE